MSIKHIKTEDLFGTVKCPMCGQVSSEVFECGCGKVFCKHCSPKDVIPLRDIIEVYCPSCKNVKIFH